MPCPRQEPAQGVCEDVQSCGIALGLSVRLGLAVGLGCPFLSPYRFLTGFLCSLGQHREVRLCLGKVLLLQTEAAALSAVVAAFPWHGTSSRALPESWALAIHPSGQSPAPAVGKLSFAKPQPSRTAPMVPVPLSSAPAGTSLLGAKNALGAVQLSLSRILGSQISASGCASIEQCPGERAAVVGLTAKPSTKSIKKRKECHVFHPNIWLSPCWGRFLQRDPVGERLVEEPMPDPRIVL